jgi:hypothetical protein
MQTRARLYTGTAAIIVAIVSSLAAAPAAHAELPSRSTQRTDLFGGHAYGSFAQVGKTVLAGKTAKVGLACEVAPPAHRVKDASSVDVPPLLSLGAIHDTGDASKRNGKSSTFSSTVGDANLLDGLITATTLTSVAQASHKGGTYAVSSQGTEFADLVVDGTPVSAEVPPNTSMPLEGLGKVVLNEQVSEVKQDSATLTVNAIHVVVDQSNDLGVPVGTQIIVAHATASLQGRQVHGILSGLAYGFSARAGDVGSVGRVAPVGISCLGTGGRTKHNVAASVDVPGVVSTGTVDDTAQGRQTGGGASVHTASSVESLDLLSSLVSATSVRAAANGVLRNGTSTFDADGSAFTGLSVQGFPDIHDDVAPNTAVDIAGLGTLYLYRVIKGSRNIEVRMIELKVLENNQYGLPVGTDIQVAVAKVGIRSA